MAEIEIPVVTDLHIERYGTYGSYVQNGIIGKYPSGDTYITQRPAVNTIAQPGDEAVSDALGRGIYYWEAGNVLYFVNNDVLYKTDYATAITTTNQVTAGTKRVWFDELDTKVIITNPESNEAFYIDTSDDEDLVEIAGSFPASIVDGVVVLDGRAYVMTPTGTIYGSDLADVTTWSALNVVTAEKKADAGVLLARHHDNLVAFGTKTIEFFYDAGLPSPGSVLSPREDVSYNVGCADGNAFWREGDTLFFLGITSSGEVAAYRMQNFQIEKISSPSLTSFLTTFKTSNTTVIGCGFSTGVNTHYVLTILDADGAPIESFVYDDLSKTWGIWEHASSEIAKFPLVDWTLSTSSILGRGIFKNGDVVEFKDDFNPVDTIGASSYYVTGYIDAGYFDDGSTSTDNIPLKIRIGHLDFETRENKFMAKLRYVGDQTTSEQDLDVQWADENHDTFTTARVIEIDKANSKLTRLGNFKSRTFDLSFSGDEQIRIQGLIAEIRKGTT